MSDASMPYCNKCGEPEYACICKEEEMPTKHGRTAKTITANVGKNIAAERRAGVPIKQAIGRAYGIARSDAKKAGIKTPKAVKPK